MTMVSFPPSSLSAEWGKALSASRGSRQISYRDTGGDGPVLLLVMGLGADSTRWAAHVQHWARSARCVAVDNAGTGATTPVQSLSTTEMADDCAAVLDHLAAEPVVAIGISMGGAVVQQLALRRPNALRCLVLVGAWGSTTPYMEAAFAQLARVHCRAPADAFVRTLQLFIWGSAYFDGHSTELDQEAVRADATMTADDFQAQVHACLRHDTTDLLGSLRTPTLLTHGTEDRLVPLRAGRALANAIPGSRLVEFAGCGHAHHWERLSDFNALVLDWMEKGA